jgi:hypothetical protein
MERFAQTGFLHPPMIHAVTVEENFLLALSEKMYGHFGPAQENFQKQVFLKT